MSVNDLSESILFHHSNASRGIFAFLRRNIEKEQDAHGGVGWGGVRGVGRGVWGGVGGGGREGGFFKRDEVNKSNWRHKRGHMCYYGININF